MRYVQAAACKGLSTRASSESPSCSALLFDDIAPVHATQHQAVQVDVEVGAEPFRHKLGWISVTAPLSASSGHETGLPKQVARDHAVHHLQLRPARRRSPRAVATVSTTWSVRGGGARLHTAFDVVTRHGLDDELLGQFAILAIGDQPAVDKRGTPPGSSANADQRHPQAGGQNPACRPPCHSQVCRLPQEFARHRHRVEPAQLPTSNGTRSTPAPRRSRSTPRCRD